LRDVFYNHYLREEYGFGKLEPWLELPLDKDAARGLREDSQDMDIQLPPWPVVKRLKSAKSERYQEMRLNASRNTARLPAFIST
jgi:hypothetical protein